MENGRLKTIAVIPARGGSKRLPRKALLEFNGKPMIAHTIDAALQAQCFDRIVVSSDSSEILEVSSSYGASTLRRSSALADSKTTTAPVLLDALDQEGQEGRSWDVLVCLYATAPLRDAGDIKAVTQLIEPGICDYAMAVCESEQPVHQAMTAQQDGALVPVWPALVNKNPESAPNYLFGNGSTYAVTVSAFRASQTLYGPGLKGHQMPREKSVDLNTEADLALLNFYAGIESATKP